MDRLLEVNIAKETEKYVINVPEVKAPESEKEPDMVAIETENKKHYDKNQKASAHAKPKQYNLGDYL